MPSTQRQPILFDHARDDEPYISLPSPYENIRLTPWRTTDADAVVPIMNHRDVYPNLMGPPYPYQKADAEWWIDQHLKRFEPDRQYFTSDETTPIREGKSFDYGPMPVIREVLVDGTHVFLGTADIRRSNFLVELDKQRQKELLKENNAKPVGDTGIVYMIGDYLAPSHHGKGIMTAAIRELIHSWGIPHMGVRELSGVVIEGNMGSRRVFEKPGFKFVRLVEDATPTQGKREKVMSAWVFRYIADYLNPTAISNS